MASNLFSDDDRAHFASVNRDMDDLTASMSIIMLCSYLEKILWSKSNHPSWRILRYLPGKHKLQRPCKHPDENRVRRHETGRGKSQISGKPYFQMRAHQNPCLSKLIFISPIFPHSPPCIRTTPKNIFITIVQLAKRIFPVSKSL